MRISDEELEVLLKSVPESVDHLEYLSYQQKKIYNNMIRRFQDIYEINLKIKELEQKKQGLII